MGTVPDFDELPRIAGLAAAWDVWPDAPEFGSLNLLTPERVVEAAALIRRGVTFGLNWSMGLPDPPLFGRSAYHHAVNGRPSGVSQDDQLDNWNTQSSSQWDGFRHVRSPGAFADGESGFFGRLDNEQHGVHHWAQRGIVGRAVLVDVGRWREAQGRPLQYDQPDPIEASEIEACLTDQGTSMREGDILLLRTGWIGWYERQAAAERARLADIDELATPGLVPGEETARVLWNLHPAAVAADNPAVELWPLGALLDESTFAAVRDDRANRMHEMFVHTLLLPMLGIPLGEMWDLEALAADCADDGRYDCFCVSAPLNLPNGVASTPNVVAIK